MADIKISELGAALTVGDSDVLPMTASGVTSKVSTSLLKDYVIGTTDISTIGDGTVTGAIDAINTDMPDGLDDLDDVSITTPADGEAPVYDSVSQKFKNTAIVTQNEFGDVIAPIEVSPSAHAYSVGKQLLYNNVLYTVTSPIAVSDALTEGTNITASDTVIEQVEDNASDIDDLRNDWKANGAYNFLPCNAKTEVINGVTITVNSDETISLANGTATSAFNIDIVDLSPILPKGTYKLVGLTVAGSSDGLRGYIDYRRGGVRTDVVDIGEGAIFTVYGDETKMAFSFYIPSGFNQSITLKPMITTDLNATVADYVPHAMTNRELTLKTLYNSNNIYVCRQGNIVIAHFRGVTPKNIADLNFASIGAKPKMYVPTFQCRCDGKPTTIEIKADGTVENVGYYSSYGSSYTDLKTNTTTAVSGTISYVAE